MWYCPTCEVTWRGTSRCWSCEGHGERIVPTHVGDTVPLERVSTGIHR
jgi:hypothetical protein